MKYLILNDIHGNLPALEAVLADPRAAACEQVISTGDHSGFGPCPGETAALLERIGARCLLGNHDWRARHHLEPQFQSYNWSLLHWTAERLPDLQAPL